MKRIRYIVWFLATLLILLLAMLHPLLGSVQVTADGVRGIEVMTPQVLPQGTAEISQELPAVQEPQPPQYTQVEESYFQDALFIGDSRTVGLSMHGDLGEADVFADEGLTVFRLFGAKVEFPEGKKTLEELLTEKQYGKIYIMLGINELGYRMERSVEKYKEMLDTIRGYQPKALIFLQANLHVTKDFSQKDQTFTNPKIDEINTAIAQMADGWTCFYLDANELFDDGEGNLDSNYASDELHIQVKYYPRWVQWLLGKGILL
ncbi:MAG: hypothetical protein IJ335_11510 [Lachnospiraceae bacterium]|nr:hypothetical protein [Lachnospiraceae bacterium]